MLIHQKHVDAKSSWRLPCDLARLKKSHLLFHLLRQHIAQINGLGVVPGPHQLDRAHEGEVVCDDLSQLGEVPAIPLETIQRVGTVCKLMQERIFQADQLHV